MNDLPKAEFFVLLNSYVITAVVKGRGKYSLELPENRICHFADRGNVFNGNFLARRSKYFLLSRQTLYLLQQL